MPQKLQFFYLGIFHFKKRLFNTAQYICDKKLLIANVIILKYYGKVRVLYLNVNHFNNLKLQHRLGF